MGAVIWQKVTTTNTTGGASIMGSFPYPRNGILKLDYEYILIFKKQGIAPKPSIEFKEQSKMTTEEWNQYFNGHWNFAGAKQEGHHAQFPEELPKRLIKMFSFVGDVVLDPFLGSGTTSLASKNLNRNSVGYEINHDYIEVIKKKLDYNQVGVFEMEIAFYNDKADIDANSVISQQLYIFKDPHMLNNKIDIKKLQFGSKIDKEAKLRDEYHSVKDILSPKLVKLDNGLIIKLIGIKDKMETYTKAMEFLFKTLDGQKVYLKFDIVKYDDENNLLCYLYLKNRTFVNARLIKAGLVDIDVSLDYRYKSKFEEIIYNEKR